MESFTMKAEFPVKPKKLQKAWLDSKMHSQMTGSPAEIDPAVGGKFTAWEGYISGTTLEIVPEMKVVQKWRTTDFKKSDPDSTLTVEFHPLDRGSVLILTHTDVPDGESESYKQGWEEFYFEPMREYFKRG